MPKQTQKLKRLSVERERQLNQRVARRLTQEIAETYKGQWVGLIHGEVVAMEPTLEAVMEKMRNVEPDPRRGMVFQAGKDYTKKKIILSVGRW
ncbi:hypothetical protein FJZ31_26690 [Candidatus Poribacteria bacterium]|nr:hypothetical protein [Candidatus Poribacteria bacterium]